MLIVCPNCATSYRIEPSSLGAAGRSVRCVRCRAVWFAGDPVPAALEGGHDAAVPPTAAAASVSEQPHADASSDKRSAADDAAPDAGWAGPAPDAGWSAPAQDEMVAAAEPQDSAHAPPVSATLPAHDGLSEPAAADQQQTQPHDDPASLEPTINEDIETFAVRHAKRRRKARRGRWRAPGLPAAITALVVANIVLIGWRADVVKIMPQTASLYAAVGLPVNLRGLTFGEVTSTTETQDGVSVLVVEGTIASASKRVVEVPRLRFSIRNQNGHEVYAWTALPGRSVLPPGETLAFRSRLASPPADGHDVIVRFFNRRDLVAGLQ